MSTHTPPTVIITGAASGMGQACAARFATEGWRVVAIDMHPQNEVAAGILPVVADIRDEGEIGDAITGAIGTDSVSALVNAAGIFPTSNLDSYSEDTYRRIFDINVLGTLNVMRVATKRMTDGGAALLFASIDAYAVSPNQLLYSASKAAVVSMTKSLAVQLADRGIVVNAIAPGWVNTPGTRAGDRLEEGVRAVPLKRAADPSEIADWAWQLCRASGYVTGETLCIAGGVIVR